MKFLACYVLPDKKNFTVITFTGWIYCIENLFTLPWKTEFFLQFSTAFNIFYHSGFLSKLRLSWKTEFALKIFTVGPIEYTFTFRIFEQLASALKNNVSWINWIKSIFFTIQDFWASCACPENRVALIFFTVLIWFYHSGFLNKLRLPWKQSLPWINCIQYTFLSFRIFEQLALSLKFFTVLKYFLSFRIFEQLALALKTELPWNFLLYWYIFYHSGFWATCTCPEIFHCIDIFLSFRIFEQLALALKTELPWNFSLRWYIFYHSGFLSNLRLPWKQNCREIFRCIDIFFITQDFWATCACPENKVWSELTVLNIYFL